VLFVQRDHVVQHLSRQHPPTHLQRFHSAKALGHSSASGRRLGPKARDHSRTRPANRDRAREGDDRFPSIARRPSVWTRVRRCHIVAGVSSPWNTRSEVREPQFLVNAVEEGQYEPANQPTAYRSADCLRRGVRRSQKVGFASSIGRFGPGID
jgi:hypothetical protein